MRTRPAIKQPTPEDLLSGLLDLLRNKFYDGQPKAWAQDRSRLLSWVILYPARWLDERGVTIPATRYREILSSVILDAVRFGNTASITYRPAWLAQVVQSHFRMHGDEIYAEAKSMRNLVENAIVVAGKASQVAPDPVRELAQAARLIAPQKRKSKQLLRGPKQLDMFSR